MPAHLFLHGNKHAIDPGASLFLQNQHWDLSFHDDIHTNKIQFVDNLTIVYSLFDYSML